MPASGAMDQMAVVARAEHAENGGSYSRAAEHVEALQVLTGEAARHRTGVARGSLRPTPCG
jgi:hypothetical protein